MFLDCVGAARADVGDVQYGAVAVATAVAQAAAAARGAGLRQRLPGGSAGEREGEQEPFMSVN